MIIGICGKSGSGKSTLARNIIMLTGSNGAYLDIDKVGHSVLTLPSVKEDLVNAFGKFVIENGVINRKRLGTIVFASSQEMEKLTEITWKHMQIEIDKFIESNANKVIILDWLLLPKSKYLNLCDMKILLDVPYEVRMKRAIARDGISEEAFALRDNASIEYDKDDFDYVLTNNTIEDIKEVIHL